MKAVVPLILLFLATSVVAHTGEAPSSFGLVDYALTLVVIVAVLTVALFLLKHLESEPGTLPIRQLGWVAGITLLVNAIIVAVLYLKVLS